MASLKYFWYDEVGRLMHDFFCKEAKDIHNAILARNVRRYKTEKEGVETMCRVSEEFEKRGKAEGKAERAVEDIQNLMKNTGWSFEQACNVLEIPAEDRPAIKEMMQQL